MLSRISLVCFLLGFSSMSACGSSERSPSERTETAFEPVQLVAGIAWRAGAPFVGRRPTSDMRTAEYAVRGHDEAELVVFHFRGEDGAEGGSVEENVGRWLDQFEQPDGRATRDVAEIDEREIDGLSVTVVRAAGTFSGVRGSGAADHVENYGLYGAIVVAPEGLVFFKLLGSREAIAASEDAFEALLDSIREVHP